VIAGGPDEAQARAFAAESIHRSGMTPRFAADGDAPCGDDGACLAERARSLGAVVALRLTIAEVGDRVVVSMLASNARGTIRREMISAADLYRADDRLAAVVRELGPPQRKQSRFGAWTLTAVSVALGLGGGLATWYAHDLKSQFFAEHVDANGDIIGISPGDARGQERRARQWSYLGGFALGGAALAGAGATLLFVRSTSGEARPAGISVAWELP
jgi:hypothetical protein